MQKVIHASLHGNAFAIEEPGYEALRAYLARAAAQLSADPDRDEILGDLEQAIADKCARYLAPHKTVVTTPEMQQVLDEMGPVGTEAGVGPEAAGAAGAAGPTAPPPEGAGTAPRAAPAGEPVRRLYRVLEGGKLAGLCNGLGAYFGIDANIMRAIFVALTLVTNGAWLLVYLVLVFVVPAAGTPEERAAARGIPFSAQQLVDETKRHYAKLEKELQGPWFRWTATWGSDWRTRRQARRAARDARRAWRAQEAARTAGPADPPGAAPIPPAPPMPPPPAYHAHYGQQVATGVVVPLMAFLSAAFTVAWVQLSAMLVTTGKVVDWSPGLPLWGSLLALLLVMLVITQPINHARAALHRAPYPGGVAWLAAWDGILWLGFLLLLLWLVWKSPGSHLQALAHDLPGAWEKVRDSWRTSH